MHEVFSIGEFSRLTGLTVKTLRFYHDQKILLPSHVDPQTGYRYYGENKLETARVIQQLRKLEFSIDDIAAILSQAEDEADILEALEQQKAGIEERLRHLRGVARSLDRIIIQQREARTMVQNGPFQIEEKALDAQRIAGVRMQGRYRDCGQGFARIGRAFGRHICGKPMMLIYDTEYKEEDADFEPCMPIRRGTSTDGIDVRELPARRCITLLHRGPYDQLGRSYQRLLQHAREHEYTIATPCREVYLKGPGMIFKGNPARYLTEIQLPID